MPPDALGHIEFEYWAENLIVYSDFIWYVAAGAVGLALVICFCSNACYYSSMSETVNEINLQMWVLKDKKKEYV